MGGARAVTGARRGLYLDQVGVPGILADVQVVVAGVLPRGLAEDVSLETESIVSLWDERAMVARAKGCSGVGMARVELCGYLRYFDARTNR